MKRIKERVSPVDREVGVVEFGPIDVHAVSVDEAIGIIAERAASGKGGFVLTPNVDHIAIATRNPEFARTYRGCLLSLADGMPLVFLSRLLGLCLRRTVSGSDLLDPLMKRCALDGLPVFFVGATAETCRAAARKLGAKYPALRVAGHDSSRFDLETAPEQAAAVLRRARERGARVILVCLPPIKQMMLSRFEDEYRPAVGVGVGSALSFYAGDMKRAPVWMSRSGLEWLHRLGHEPRRLWRRYLVEDMATLPVFMRMIRDRLAGKPLQRICHMTADARVSDRGR